MRARPIVAAALVVLVALAAGVAWWQRRSGPELAAAAVPASSSTAPGDGASASEIAPPCDPIPAAPPLPAALTPSAPTVEAIVQALDAALGPEHKAYLRCFSDEDVLVARVHFGMGRWLRRTLRLRQTGRDIQALRDLDVKEPDDVSAVIVRAYARHLRDAPIDLADAVDRTRRMADIPGVAQ